MFPSALEIEQRWLHQHNHVLQQLLRKDDLACSIHHCDSSKAIQRKLRAFDHDNNLHLSLIKTPPLNRSSSSRPYNINPRKAISAATRVIFRDAHGAAGIDHKLAMQGIVSLDQLEKHRVILVNTAKREITAVMADTAQLSLLLELHNAATLHYGLFHMGFRAAVLIHCLDPRRRSPKDQAMAKLNALFPPAAAAGLDTELPLAPYSQGLRENIRFCVYEHLMRDNTDDMDKWQALHTRLFSWCNMPGYAEARAALLRYTEEFKKLELLCLSTLHSLECRGKSVYLPESPCESSFLTTSSKSSTAPSPSSSLLGSDKSDFEAAFQTSSHPSLASAKSLSPFPRYTQLSSPLLHGMPGREISAAKTDGAAFARDTDAAPVLVYPNDLSQLEFDQHPLARRLDMSPREKIQLGLIIPKQLSSRDF